jgi:DNA polymerase III alpha subunit (gram-positive type)
MIVLDFEASSLVDGYPVSVGIAASDGRLLYRVIKPHPEWTEMRWDPVSESVHGLTRTFVEADGVSVDDVMAEMNELFRDEVIVSDNPPFEWRWLQLLIEYGRPAALQLSRVEAGTILADAAAKTRITEIELRDIKRQMGLMMRHHALFDAAGWIAGIDAAQMPKSAGRHARIRGVFADWRQRVEEHLAIGNRS